MVYIFLAEGFEEVEAVTIIDYLRRAGIDIRSVSITVDINVTGAHAILMKSDLLIEDADFDACEMIVLPGGLPGTDYLAADERLTTKIKEFAAAGKKVAAICAAPTVLAEAGVLNGIKATCYPSRKDELNGAEYVEDAVVTDGIVTTSRGPSTAVRFALELIKLLKDQKTSDLIKADILLD